LKPQDKCISSTQPSSIYDMFNRILEQPVDSRANESP
jgi:hypothetical protein